MEQRKKIGVAEKQKVEKQRISRWRNWEAKDEGEKQMIDWGRRKGRGMGGEQLEEQMRKDGVKSGAKEQKVGQSSNR